MSDQKAKASLAEQNAATTSAYFPYNDMGGGGGGGNPVVMGRLTSDLNTPASDQYDDAAEGTAVLQSVNATSGILVDGATVSVFALGKHNAFTYAGTQVSMVKDDAFTEKKGSGNWYRLIQSPVAQDVYVRLKTAPTDSWLGAGGDFYVYKNTDITPSTTDCQIWEITSSEVGDNTQFDVRLRTGFPVNTQDVYKGQYWPETDLLIVDQTACIMANVGGSIPVGAKGCFQWAGTGDAYYPMGKRFSIVGQFAADVASGESAAFHLAKWDKDEDDFAKEEIDSWAGIKFASGAVVNVAGFEVGGSATFDASKDIVACQYDEAAGVYLAAPLRCS